MVRLLKPDRKRPRNFTSRRNQLRLLGLFVPLALVILLMGRLRDPKTANAVNAFFAQPASHSIKPRPPVADTPATAPQPFPGIRPELLKTIEDNTYFRTDEKDAWFHFIELVQAESANTNQGVPVEYAQLVGQPNAYRGKLVNVRGTARQITQEKPAENGLGISAYHRVVIQPADGANWPVIVYCIELPNDVAVGDNVSFDVTATGLFFKKLSYKSQDGLGTAPVIVATTLTTGHIAAPDLEPIDVAMREPSATETASNSKSASGDPTLGKSLLDKLGFDAAMLDQIQSRGRIRSEERIAFYRMLQAVGDAKPGTLIRSAQLNLPSVRHEWLDQTKADGPPQRKALAREVVRQADEGRYSVAQLFNDPQPQIGRLFVFDGTARRAVRVEVGDSAIRRSEVAADSYGFDHYYELEVFTNDSQNFPLIFCMRELPKDFPIGADIHVPVRAAGFFFKNWLYNTRGRGQSEYLADGTSTGPRAQFAPLFIGKSPIMLPTAQGGKHVGQFVLGGLFVLGLGAVCAAAISVARDDRRFRERTASAKFALPPGQSLNDLNLPAADMPMTTEVASPPAGETSK